MIELIETRAAAAHAGIDHYMHERPMIDRLSDAIQIVSGGCGDDRENPAAAGMAISMASRCRPRKHVFDRSQDHDRREG